MAVGLVACLGKRGDEGHNAPLHQIELGDGLSLLLSLDVVCRGSQGVLKVLNGMSLKQMLAHLARRRNRLRSALRVSCSLSGTREHVAEPLVVQAPPL